MTIFSFLAQNHQSPNSPLALETIKRPRRALGTWTSVNEQIYSPFLTVIPAEIRNQIYIYLLTTSYSQISGDDTTFIDDSPPPLQPLAILQTCRKIYLETALLAFRTHNFHITGDSSFHSLRARTTHLPSPLFDAITSVSFTPSTYRLYTDPRCDIYGTKSDAEILNNVLLLFPNISLVTMRMRLQSMDSPELCTVNHFGYSQTVHLSRGVNSAGVHEARWFWASMNIMCKGWKAKVWEREGAWSWKRLKSGEDDDYLDFSSARIVSGEVSTRHCAAVLEQKGSERKVNVCMILAKEADLGERARLGSYVTEGMEGVGVEEVRSKRGSVGYRFDPGDMYWGDLHNRVTLMKGGIVDRGRDEEVPRVVDPVRRGWLERWFRF
jgi:hypothetical protein